MKNILIMAPIAAGKGTQSKLLKEKYDYVHISTGDMFREIISSGTELGEKIRNIINSGNLIDDELTIELVKQKLHTLDGRPFILDGFPRTLHQAEIFNEMMNDANLDYQVIYLDLSREIAMKRTLGRLVCKDCGKSYNIYNPLLAPKDKGVCDYCNTSLFRREEDTETSFNLRYNALMENLEPVIELYQSLDKVVIIDAEEDVNEIFKKISEVIYD